MSTEEDIIRLRLELEKRDDMINFLKSQIKKLENDIDECQFHLSKALLTIRRSTKND